MHQKTFLTTPDDFIGHDHAGLEVCENALKHKGHDSDHTSDLAEHTSDLADNTLDLTHI
jgi:hypothetical protein